MIRFHQMLILMLFFHRPIHRIIRKAFFLILHTANRSSNSPCNNSDNKDHNILEFYMMPTYKHPINIGWNNGYWIFQFIDFCKYLILPFKNSLRIGFYLQAIRVVIANMNIEIVYQAELPFKLVYQFGNPYRERNLIRLFFSHGFLQY